MRDKLTIPEFNRYAVEQYPNEAGAVIAGGQLHMCKNVAEDPTRDFCFDQTEYSQIVLEHGPIERVIHSHPYENKVRSDLVWKPEWPSHQDMISWIAMGVPFGIVGTDGEQVTETLWLNDAARDDLLGRDFVWGVNDCYSAIRDFYFMELGIDLPNFPRGWKFWEVGDDLYMKGFAQAGFRQIRKDEAKKYDVLLYKFPGFPIVNHGAVMNGDDYCLHQFHDQVSKVYSRRQYLRFEVMALRHESR